MLTHRNYLLSGVVFAKEPTGGLLGGSKPTETPAPEETASESQEKAESAQEGASATEGASGPTPTPDPAPAPAAVDPDLNPFAGKASRIEVPLSFGDDPEEDPLEGLTLTDEGFIKPVAAYKHKNVMRFQVGDFIFQNHLLFVYSEDDNRRFLDLARGLTSVDRGAIVHYNWEAAANVEKPVNYESTVSRGGVSTGKTKDPKLVQ